MWVCNIKSSPVLWAGGLYISGVDFGCFSTSYRDCEALIEREEQTDFTLLILYVFLAFDKVLPPRCPLDAPYMPPISIL